MWVYFALSQEKNPATIAPSEDRTHDLRIMRPTRCLLRHRGGPVLWLSLSKGESSWIKWFSRGHQTKHQLVNNSCSSKLCLYIYTFTLDRLEFSHGESFRILVSCRAMHCRRGCGSVVERSLCMWKAPGSIPGISMIFFCTHSWTITEGGSFHLGSMSWHTDMPIKIGNNITKTYTGMCWHMYPVYTFCLAEKTDHGVFTGIRACNTTASSKQFISNGFCTTDYPQAWMVLNAEVVLSYVSLVLQLLGSLSL